MKKPTPKLPPLPKKKTVNRLGVEQMPDGAVKAKAKIGNKFFEAEGESSARAKSALLKKITEYKKQK